jgi:hypothetical protein
MSCGVLKVDDLMGSEKWESEKVFRMSNELSFRMMGFLVDGRFSL